MYASLLTLTLQLFKLFQEYIVDPSMDTARYVNTDFPPHPSWSDLGLVVLVDHPGYSTTKSIGLRHWVAADFGGLGRKLPAVGSWLPAGKTPPGKFLTVALAPAGWGAVDPTLYGCACGKTWSAELGGNE
jgi:hypothetical protein